MRSGRQKVVNVRTLSWYLNLSSLSFLFKFIEISDLFLNVGPENVQKEVTRERAGEATETVAQEIETGIEVSDASIVEAVDILLEIVERKDEADPETETEGAGESPTG